MPATTLDSTDRAKALGAFLKRTRASRVADSAVPAAPRRRVKGLRREEVALAAGISVTWYTWIEQGRAVTCSRATLDRIALALRMDRTERKHLFDLASPSGDQAAATISMVAPPELTPVIDALRVEPAFVVNGLWDVLHFNAACAAVLGPFERGSRATGNVLRRLFLDEQWRTRFADRDRTVQSAVAQFRSMPGRLHGTDTLLLFLATLAEESAEFRALWERKHLAPPPIKQKTFNHATAGALTMHYARLRPDTAAVDVSIVLYVPDAQSFAAVQRLMGV